MFHRLSAVLGILVLAAGCGSSGDAADAPSEEAALETAPDRAAPEYTGQIYVSSRPWGTGVVVDAVQKYDLDGSLGCTGETVDGYTVVRCDEPVAFPFPTVPVNLGTVRVWSGAGSIEVVPHVPNSAGYSYYDDKVVEGLRLWSRPHEPIHTSYTLPNGRTVTTLVFAPANDIVNDSTFPSTLARNEPLEVRWSGADPHDAGFIEVTLIGGLQPTSIPRVSIRASARPQRGHVTFSKEILALLPSGPAEAFFEVRSSAVDRHGLEHNLYSEAGGVTHAAFTVE